MRSARGLVQQVDFDVRELEPQKAEVVTPPNMCDVITPKITPSLFETFIELSRS
jgi:hypothetical protein